jgi:hypothetical protein
VNQKFSFSLGDWQNICYDIFRNFFISGKGALWKVAERDCCGEKITGNAWHMHRDQLALQNHFT